MRKVWLDKQANFNKLNNEILEFQWEQFLHQCTNVEDMSNRVKQSTTLRGLVSTTSTVLNYHLRD
jgi:hypothetical protein